MLIKSFSASTRIYKIVHRANTLVILVGRAIYTTLSERIYKAGSERTPAELRY